MRRIAAHDYAGWNTYYHDRSSRYRALVAYVRSDHRTGADPAMGTYFDLAELTPFVRKEAFGVALVLLCSAENLCVLANQSVIANYCVPDDAIWSDADAVPHGGFRVGKEAAEFDS